MWRKILLIITALGVLSCSSSQKGEDKAPYIESLGGLRSSLSWSRPSEVLKKYEELLKYRVDDPKQDFLHELNLAGLSLMAGMPQKARRHLIAASRWIDWQNYTSILNEVSEVVLLKSIQERYPLQPQEYVVLNYLGTLTYLYENDWKNALVGVRAMHESLRRMEQSFPGVQIPSLAYFYFFAGYIYEQNGQYDDARIDYERVRALNPKWQNLDLHLWRVYELTGEGQKADEYAKRLKYEKLPLSQRRKIAQIFPLKAILWQHYATRGRVSLDTTDIHIERTTKNGELSIWGQEHIFSAYSRLEIDREVAAHTPKKMDNPAYLLHVNPYSVSYLVLGTLFKAYWEASGMASNKQFVVKSFGFLPEGASLLYVNACEADEATCEFKTYSVIEMSEYYLKRKNLTLLQTTGDGRLIPFK